MQRNRRHSKVDYTALLDLRHLLLVRYRGGLGLESWNQSCEQNCGKAIRKSDLG